MIATDRNLGRRIDLHIHSILSDGVLLPSEIAQRASVLNYEAIAITDHVDSSNIRTVVSSLASVSKELKKHLDVRVIPGVEITHLPPPLIGDLAGEAIDLGAKLIVVHGETLVEPVQPHTNLEALKCELVDILAHPGLITKEEAELARRNEIYLELSARPGHSLANGHVARTALEAGAKLVLNTDLHQPEEFLTQESAFRMVLGAGLQDDDAIKVVRDHPRELVERVKEED